MGITKDGKVVSHIYKPKLITRDGEEVERVLYIESSGNNDTYIDPNITNFNGKNYEFETDIYVLTKTNNTWPALFGSVDSNYDYGNYAFYLHSTDNQVSGRAGTNNGQIGNHNYSSLDNKWANIIYSRNNTTQILTVNGTSQTREGGNNGSTNRKPYLFCINQNDSAIYPIKARIRNFKVYVEGNLVRHFIPVKYGTEYCMLDLVENKLYHNKGTGSFSGGDRVEVKKISKIIVDNGVKYYLLDCLQSTGTQKIDTNINCNNIGKIETRFSIQNAIGSGGQMLYGYYHSNTASAKRGSNYLQYTQSSMYIYGGGQRNFSPSQRPIMNNIYKLQIPIAKAGTGYLFDDDGTQRATVSVVGTLETGKMTLFVIGGNSTVASHYSSAKIYYFKMYDLDDNLISDLVPVEKEDGTKGMLDLVSHTFYENTGTGTFSGIKKEIILVE